MTHPVVFGKSGGLFDVNFFIEFSVEKSCFDVHVLKFPVMDGG